LIILDSNVISALMNDPPESKVVAWFDRQPGSSIWTTSISILEIQFGLQSMATGKRRDSLSQVFEIILREMDGRVAVFDEDAARTTASLMASRQKAGRVGELRDSMIAGIVLARRAGLATRNLAHFADISATVVNPWNT
jgi:predicted nucleic acid-binding protein